MSDAAVPRRLIQNLAIAASAGSGKTYQLAHRYIGLLLRGVPPDRIVALTFSRKAAGEIFDSIIKYLVKAAGSESARLHLAEVCGLQELPVNHLLDVLRNLLSNLHRLQVGTLDSFAVRLLAGFPVEFGIDYGFEIIDNDSAAAQMLQREILLKLLGGSFLKKDDRLGFLKAFRMATFGREERRLADLLQDFIAEYHELYLRLPAEENWGSAEKIWPHGAFWQQAPSDIIPLSEELARLVQEELPERARKRWLDFIEEVRVHRIGRPLNRPMTYFLEKILPEFEYLGQGGLELKMDRQIYEIGKRVGSLCQQHICYLLSMEMEAACRKTRGIYRVVSYYEQLYEQTVRRRGRLTFDDVHLLLGPDNRYNRGLRLSSFAGEGRLAIDYRLDGHIDHWLLDEFQDTSTSQWLMLANLIDEVVQDDSGGRSFFYVGDVKQAIYRWRGGNADLFGQILQHYQGAIEQQPLDRSYRFCLPVTDTVNRVFDDLPDDLPAATVQDWRSIWRRHSCETSIVPKTGYVALVEPSCDKRSKPDAVDRYQVVAALLQELEPMTRDLSVAVLVRKNSQGGKLVQFLRSGLPGHVIVHEGSAEIAANPVCGLLLSLIKFSAHPGDTLALKHLQMSPLHAAIMTTDRGYRMLPLLVLEQIQSQGFRGCLAHWGEELDRLGGLDRYGRRKLQELLLAADRFDAAYNRSCNDFLAFIKGYSRRQTAAAGSIRVMTVHQAKGLGFDVVLLPELQDGSMESGSRSDVALLADPKSGQTSLLNLPQRIFAEADPVLAAVFAERQRAAAFDELCTLYVAMTRAKKALYLITSFQGRNSNSFTQGALVKLQLHGEKNPPSGPVDEICGQPVTLLFEKGDRRWYEKEKKQGKESTGKPILSLSEEYRRQASVSKMIQVSPSGEAEHEKTAASLFSTGTSGSLQFGSGVHSLFEMLSWYSEAEEASAVDSYRRGGNAYDTSFREEVVAHFKAALAAPAVRKALGKPPDNALLWREREFDVVIDGRWVSGIFDRVVIEADSEGGPLKAAVQDYKTNRVDSPETLHRLTEEYRPQMLLYRQALSLLLNLPQDRIDLQLIFTGIGEVVQVA